MKIKHLFNVRTRNSGFTVSIGPFSVARDVGVVSAPDVVTWCIFHSCWMYGPYSRLSDCVRAVFTEWKNDKYLIG